jgi:aryl sulfotransferase
MTGFESPRRLYQNHHFDSTRWRWFETRPDDIVIATSYKAGTTWTQAIVANLLFPDSDFPDAPGRLSPWLDARTVPLETVLGTLEAQQHRRYIKTHLPFDCMPHEERLKYIYVSRDARDVFMSLWNHYSRHNDRMFAILNNLLERVGDEFPRPEGDIHDFWRNWITRGWFEDETDGWPYWSHFSNVQSWWDERHRPNILLCHFSDMLDDTENEIRRIAEFLEIEVPDSAWSGIVERVSFAEMKKDGERYAPLGGGMWKGGADTFMNKGTNGRWRDVLTTAELELYAAACDRTLTPDCRTWMENGGHP